MSLDTDFQAYLDSLTVAPVQENTASEDKGEPRVWWQRAEGNSELLLNGNTALGDTVFNVEVSGLDIDATATVADTLKTTLHGHRGLVGSTQVLAMFVQDQSDDYTPKSLDADEGFHVFSFAVRVLT